MSSEIREDKEKMKQLYIRLVSAVTQSLPEDWTNLCVGFFVASDGEESYFVHYSLNGGDDYTEAVSELMEQGDFGKAEGLFDGKELCQELHAYCSAHGDSFTQFTLCVDAKGRFQADFAYDAFDAFDAFRIQQWKGTYLYR